MAAILCLSAGTAKAATAAEVLGFEAPAAWQAPGIALGVSAEATQGTRALAAWAHGYVRLDSAPVGGVTVTRHVAYDVRMPATQANPWWYGYTELFVSAPSKGIYNQPVGHQELAALPLGQFRTVQMDVPAWIARALAGGASDLSFGVVLNVPWDQSAPYVLDNLRFVEDTRIRVMPVLFVPNDATLSDADEAAARDLLSRHLATAQRRWQIALGTDTFYFDQPVRFDAPRSAAQYEAGTSDAAHAMTRALFDWTRENRTTSRHVFLAIFVRPAGQSCLSAGHTCLGGGRTFNRGPDSGGGFIHLEYQSLVLDRAPYTLRSRRDGECWNIPPSSAPADFPYFFLSTLEHELGHGFGLSHNDCFGQDLCTGESMMGYSFTHWSRGLTESATPGNLMPEEYRTLDDNTGVFPAFTFVPAIHNPTGRTLVNIGAPWPCYLGAMDGSID